MIVQDQKMLISTWGRRLPIGEIHGEDRPWFGRLELCRDRLKRAISASYTQHTRSIARLLVIAGASKKETLGAYQKRSLGTSSGAIPRRQKAL